MLIASYVGPIIAKSLPAARRVLNLQLCRAPTFPSTHTSKTRVIYIPIQPGAGFALPQPASLRPLPRVPNKSRIMEPSGNVSRSKDSKERPSRQSKQHSQHDMVHSSSTRSDLLALAQPGVDVVVVGPSSIASEDAIADQFLQNRLNEPAPLRLSEMPQTSQTESTTDLLPMCLQTIATSSSADEIWEAYMQLREYLQERREQNSKSFYPLHRPLHTVARFLSRNKPRTRPQFLRLLNVVQFIHECGGKIHPHEWNALIHHAGRGWRKTRVEDFQLAMDLYIDMVTGKSPGTTTTGIGSEEGARLPRSPVQPNIITFTTLLALAARTLHAPSIRRATNLLHEAGLKPNRITHLAMLRYFTLTRQISGVRSTIIKMKEQGLELGIDGLNACIWAYAHIGDVDVVSSIYQVLRYNTRTDTSTEEGIVAVRRRLVDEQGIDIDHRLTPDEATFTTVIQCLAYHDDIVGALGVFMDMLSVPTARKADFNCLEDDDLPGRYSPTMAIFRAIFLGFARHGEPPGHPLSRTTALYGLPQGRETWSLHNLQTLFDAFMDLPLTERPSLSTIHWILIAFMKTTNNHPETLRDVWTRLETRFEGPWGGPNNRLQRLKKRIFSQHSTRVSSTSRVPGTDRRVAVEI